MNHWNRFIYALWSPFYDMLVRAKAIARARRMAFDLLPLKAGDHVCLVGVGTGVDFEYLPEGVTAVGIDLSKAMLAKAKKKLPIPGREITLECANAEELRFPDDSFDAAILTLIVSVAADGAACMGEAVRVTRPGGHLLVFDKFLLPDSSPSIGRRLFNLLTRTFGTNINRPFEPMISELPITVLKDEPVLFSGAYRAILLKKHS